MVETPLRNLAPHMLLVGEAKHMPSVAFGSVRIEGRVKVPDTLIETTNLQLQGLAFIDNWISQKVPNGLPDLPDLPEDQQNHFITNTPQYVALERDLPKIIDLRDGITGMTALEQAARGDVDGARMHEVAGNAGYMLNKLFKSNNEWDVLVEDGKFVVHKYLQTDTGERRIELTMQSAYKLATRKLKSIYAATSEETGVPLPDMKSMGGISIRNQEDIEFMARKLPIVIHDLYSPLLMAHSSLPMLVYASRDVYPLVNPFLRNAPNASIAAQEIWKTPMNREDIPTATIPSLAQEILGELGEGYEVVLSGEVPEGTIELSTPLLRSLFVNIMQNTQKAYARRDELRAEQRGTKPPSPKRLTVNVTYDGNTVNLVADDEGPGFPPEIAETGRFKVGDTTGWGSKSIASSGYAMGSLSEFFKVYGASIRPENRIDPQTEAVLGARLHVSFLLTPKATDASAS